MHEILNLVKSKVQQKMNLLQIKSPNNFVEDIYIPVRNAVYRLYMGVPP